jgi:hypothetical protein
MNIPNSQENQFEKVLVSNSLYTIFETKAYIYFKRKRLQFNFNEIKNIKIVKEEKKILNTLFFLVSATILFFVFAVFEKTLYYNLR